MKIRTGTISEIENFPLYNEENKGEEIIVVEHDGQIVAYAQFNSGRDDAEIFFMESTMKGAGRAIIEHFQGDCVEITAINAIETAQGFYARMGFEENGGGNMTWWNE